jgi:uncharacterized DUF497 family protein
MRIEFDDEKRRWTLEKRGLDFADVRRIFVGARFSVAGKLPQRHAERLLDPVVQCRKTRKSRSRFASNPK